LIRPRPPTRERVCRSELAQVVEIPALSGQVALESQFFFDLGDGIRVTGRIDLIWRGPIGSVRCL
jgi:hypothetical protein